MRYFVTFGAGQYGGALANSYLEFEAPDEMTVRRFMSKEFGGTWCGLYDEEEFAHQPREYGLTRLVKYDEYGNILERGRAAGDPLTV